MPDKFYKEFQETVAQVRGLLEDLKHLGVAEVPGETDLDARPVCQLSEVHSSTSCRSETLEEISADLGDCQRCGLSKGRNHIVFGAGNASARLVLVGEAPGRDEDLQGLPFVGEAGRLLERILFAMGFKREDVYICNVQKCRPPKNRDPLPEEIAACVPFLQRQLAALQPQVIVTLGRFAAQTLLDTSQPISSLRGHWQSYEGIAVLPTYHPAFLLRNPAAKREVWEDMKQVMSRLRQGDS
ncbi:DNA polymerase [Syntrophotalea acetylenivorans]|uniref:Type-4 uracil-DNA glycosylase n=1 Tax=Syntrophotalea acetylenivorans TaxID=1842532 RepID=A0A1L3GKQ2_9BACT|nr:uracil-DNA glycosylase [Syntrophotalea acetylenivorans]APG26502.1 DNA polymerase [Syntrophotalea acetylenivorans]